MDQPSIWQITILSLFNDPANPLMKIDRLVPYSSQMLLLQEVLKHPLSGYIICLAGLLRSYYYDSYSAIDMALGIANKEITFPLRGRNAPKAPQVLLSEMEIHRVKYHCTDTYRIKQKLHDHYDHCQLGDCPECEGLMTLLSKLNNCVACGISRNEMVTLLMISGRLGLYLPDEMYRYVSQFLHMGFKHICVCRKCKGTAILCGKCIVCDPLPDKYVHVVE